MSGEQYALLARYLRLIQVQRQDFNGRVLTVRNGDMMAIACILGIELDGAANALDELGLRYQTGLRCARLVPCPSASASTSTSRSAPSAATTARSPPGPTAAPDRAATSRRSSPRSTGPSPPACRPATSVFFGGGTPSLVPAGLLMRGARRHPARAVGRGDRRVQPRHRHAPTSCGTYRDHGVSRISLGVQSMVPHVLAALGRTHDPANVRRAVDLVREVGFASFNLDLIYGGAGESLADWEATLRARARRSSRPT